MQQWCLTPDANGAFVAAMEEILAVYARPVDPQRPLICFDEGGKQLQAETGVPLRAAPGQLGREDYTDERRGGVNLFLAVAPPLGWRTVWRTAHRTTEDFAQAIRHLLDDCWPEAAQLVLVTDNLNTHTKGAFYQTFPAAAARRLLERIEWHDIPKHGSWLNMAERELAVLTRPCLARRIPDQTTLDQELVAWLAPRNAARTRLRWTFTLEEAREVLHHVYPIPPQDN